jgi:glycosyltransferase involved in cell wall biosynthesis
MERFNATDKMIARTSLGLSANDLIYLLPSDPTRPEKRSDRAQVIAHANQAKLVTLGATPPLEVATWISAADLVLIPSDREGFGLALLEALACEKPVLSTPNGIAPAAVDGVEGAESLAWDEAVWTVAADRLSQLSNTTGGRSSAGRWSSEVCAADVVDAWREALAAG